MIQQEWQTRGRDFLLEHAARGDRRAAEIVRELLLAQTPGASHASGMAIRAIIGVCTSMRPGMLTHCLGGIAAQIVPPGVEIHVVVVDNEPAPNNRRIVQALRAHFAFPLHYVHEPRRGIAKARNGVLRQGRALDAHWLAMTDDDCWVSPAWLAGLLEAARHHNVDVVYGRRELLFPVDGTFWALPEPTNQADGQTLPYAATHNVLMDGWLIRDGGRNGARGGLAFDERLAHGEDTDFFHRATQRGARIVYAREPVVFETVSPERATLGYQTRRAYHYAASRSYFHRRHNGLGRAMEKLAARWLFQTPVAVLRLASAPLVWPFSRFIFRQLVMKGSARLAGAAGAAAGLLGFDGNPYRTIDGH
jgi:succinoglycan biosynthesis protein ExoM